MAGNGFNMRQAHTYEVLAMQSGMYALLCLYRCERSSKGHEFADCLTHTLEIITMARGKGSTTENTGGAQGWTTFVDIPIAGVSPSDLDDRYGSWDDFDSDLSALLSSGYRVGVSYNSGNSAFIVSVTCRDDSSPNVGCTFTSFAGEWWTAIKVALYKHYVVTEGDWKKGGKANTTGHFG